MRDQKMMLELLKEMEKQPSGEIPYMTTALSDNKDQARHRWHQIDLLIDRGLAKVDQPTMTEGDNVFAPGTVRITDAGYSVLEEVREDDG